MHDIKCSLNTEGDASIPASPGDFDRAPQRESPSTHAAALTFRHAVVEARCNLRCLSHPIQRDLVEVRAAICAGHVNHGANMITYSRLLARTAREWREAALAVAKSSGGVAGQVQLRLQRCAPVYREWPFCGNAVL